MSHRLQVLIPEELDARLRKASQRRGISVGEWVRIAIVDSLQTPAGRKPPLQRLACLRGPTGDIEDMIAEIESGRR
jgi:hypothetical protein